MSLWDAFYLKPCSARTFPSGVPPTMLAVATLDGEPKQKNQRKTYNTLRSKPPPLSKVSAARPSVRLAPFWASRGGWRNLGVCYHVIWGF